jgi:hypothetical protein
VDGRVNEEGENTRLDRIYKREVRIYERDRAERG